MSYILCSLISIGSHGLIRAPRRNIAHEHRPVDENDDDDDHDGYNKKDDDDGDGNVIDM